MEQLEPYRQFLDSVLAMRAVPMRKDCASQVPAEQGVYVVSDHSLDGNPVIYVGRTKSGNLRSRLTSCHLSGDLMSARIKAGLVRCGTCQDNPAARVYVESNCRAGFDEIADESSRRFTEHFLTAYFRPSLNA